MDQRTIASDWSSAFLDLRYDTLPPETMETAKLALLDFVGVAIGGSRLPVGRLFSTYYSRLGGVPEATVMATGERLPGIHAATVNGVHGHALEMDDGHRHAAGHPGAAVLPAALAAAEMYACSGEDLLRAIVIGYEVFIRVGSAINPAHLRRGFHTTATVGPLAAAAAAGALRPGMTREIFERAIGLAGVQGAGLLEVLRDGAMAKPFQTGRGSAAGLLAVELAAIGVEGPRTVVEGAAGFLGAMADPIEPDALTNRLGEEWAIGGIYFKGHASCRHTHPAIDGVLRLRAEGLRPEEVRSISVLTYSVAEQLCGTAAEPAGPDEAKFSIPFTVALALELGHAGPSGFAPETVRDERLRSLARRVRVATDPTLDRAYPGRRGATVMVERTDGTQLTAEIPLPRGEPELPFGLADLRTKFRENLRGSFSADTALELERRLLALDRLHRLIDLWAGLTREPTATKERAV